MSSTATALAAGLADDNDSGWRRLTFYVSLQIVSVLAPGLVLGAQFVWWLTPAHHSLLSDLTALLAPSNTLLTFTYAVVGLATAYVIGYLAREASFSMLGRIETRFGGVILAGEPEVTRASLVAVHGETAVSATEAAHPIFAAAFSDTPLTAGPPLGGGHKASLRFEAFVYSKLWLRRHNQALNVDAMELEINALAAAYAPLLVAVANLAHDPHFSTLQRSIGAVVALVASWHITRSLLRLRRGERGESLRNLVADMAMRQAEVRYAAIVDSSVPKAPPAPPAPPVPPAPRDAPAGT